MFDSPIDAVGVTNGVIGEMIADGEKRH